MQLPTPAQIKREFPLRIPEVIASWRMTARNVLERTDSRLALIIGPCSIHDPKSALEYAARLKKLSPEIDQTFFPIMRIFIEKPRSRIGWKGMVYDPHLNGSNDIAEGLRQSRELILKIAEIGIPCASELLEPLVLPYIEDLVVWGLIGARTSASQPHRQMVSGLDFPVGFKNDIRGNIDVALGGILTSRIPHTHIGIDSDGHIASIHTKGNPYSHLVLRGAENAPNFDRASVNAALQKLLNQQLEERLLIDCSHDNCGKDHLREQAVFESVMKQAVENKAIAGVMLESHLFAGKQALYGDPSHLSYGVSITDACIGWEETETLLRSLSTSTLSVQK
jgi:3-deoxy-7-phosphoheptulonate synthase